MSCQWFVALLVLMLACIQGYHFRLPGSLLPREQLMGELYREPDGHLYDFAVEYDFQQELGTGESEECVSMDEKQLAQCNKVIPLLISQTILYLPFVAVYSVLLIPSIDFIRPHGMSLTTYLASLSMQEQALGLLFFVVTLISHVCDMIPGDKYYARKIWFNVGVLLRSSSAFLAWYSLDSLRPLVIGLIFGQETLNLVQYAAVSSTPSIEPIHATLFSRLVWLPCYIYVYECIKRAMASDDFEPWRISFHITLAYVVIHGLFHVTRLVVLSFYSISGMAPFHRQPAYAQHSTTATILSFVALSVVTLAYTWLVRSSSNGAPAYSLDSITKQS